jgi:hypothetical protein
MVVSLIRWVTADLDVAFSYQGHPDSVVRNPETCEEAPPRLAQLRGRVLIAATSAGRLRAGSQGPARFAEGSFCSAVGVVGPLPTIRRSSAGLAVAFWGRS